MKCFRFEVREEVVTWIEVMANSEHEARDRVFRQDDHVTAYDAVRGDLRIVLRHVDEK